MADSAPKNKLNKSSKSSTASAPTNTAESVSATDAASASASAAAAAAVSDFPSTNIGSYLSRDYDIAVESKRVPGFICGSCNCLNSLKARESIRCRDCGYRIMYKERLRRPMIYSAE